MVLTALAMAWTGCTLMQLQLYIVSDAIMQWYFREFERPMGGERREA